jgi:hypothetical protein
MAVVAKAEMPDQDKTVKQLLHKIVSQNTEAQVWRQSIDRRVGVLEATLPERHNLIQQPKAVVKTKVVKATKVAKKAKTPREASASIAHHAMKAELKTMPKEVQEAFSQVWVAIRQDAGYGKQGNIPLLDYFELQSDAFKAVVGA